MCVRPQDGRTALYLAAHEGTVDVVRLLTEAEARVNLQTKVRIIQSSIQNNGKR